MKPHSLPVSCSRRVSVHPEWSRLYLITLHIRPLCKSSGQTSTSFTLVKGMFFAPHPKTLIPSTHKAGLSFPGSISIKTKHNLTSFPQGTPPSTPSYSWLCRDPTQAIAFTGWRVSRRNALSLGRKGASVKINQKCRKGAYVRRILLTLVEGGI